MTHTDEHFPSPNDATRNMILGQIFTGDIADKRILRAMAETPRESFVPEPLRGACHADEDLPIGGGRALMAPLTLAKLLDLAKVRHSDHVLVVGGDYAAAVAAHLSKHVTAIESDAASLTQALAHLTQLHISNVKCHQIPELSYGCPAAAPYDLILIPAGVQTIPESLTAQLAAGGRLVTVRISDMRPGRGGGPGKGIIIARIDGKLQEREHFDAAATLLPGFEQAAGFAF